MRVDEEQDTTAKLVRLLRRRNVTEENWCEAECCLTKWYGGRMCSHWAIEDPNRLVRSLFGE